MTWPSIRSRAAGVWPPPGGSVAAWVDLLSTDQGSSPVDTGSMATAASFSGGLFNVTTSNVHAITVDGYREAMVRWTADVASLFPSFDAETDLLQLRLVTSAGFEAPDNDGYGVFVGVLDRGVDDLVNADGAMFALRRLNTTNNQSVAVSRTALAATNNVGLATRTAGTFQFWRTVAPPSLDFDAQMVVSTGSLANPDYNDRSLQSTDGGPLRTDPSTWKIHVGVAHFSTTARSVNLQWRVQARALRTTGWAA